MSDSTNEDLEAIELMRTAQAAKARSVQSKLAELGIDSFPCKLASGEKLSLGISIPFAGLEALEEHLNILIVTNTLDV